MADIKQRASVECRITMTLTESEARALDALAGYDENAFIAAFYREMGRHYMSPYEQGMRMLLKSIRRTIPDVLARIDLAREVFEGDGKKDATT